MDRIVKDCAAETVEKQGYVTGTLGIAKGGVQLAGLNVNVT